MGRNMSLLHYWNQATKHQCRLLTAGPRAIASAIGTAPRTHPAYSRNGKMHQTPASVRSQPSSDPTNPRSALTDTHRTRKDAPSRQQQLDNIDPGLMPELQDAILQERVEASTMRQENKVPQEILTGEGDAQVFQHASGFIPPTAASDFEKSRSK
ncbi:hypothetical protein DXG01_005150 [Tephrocybe rancida]|nr:hypothetical protein DXG01_005150 [Tephrocybe rancida]